MRFSPRVAPALAAHVAGADVERQPIAETWRGVRVRAAELGLTAPGYHAVRLLVLSERERRAVRRELIVASLDQLWVPLPDVAEVARRGDAVRSRSGRRGR